MKFAVRASCVVLLACAAAGCGGWGQTDAVAEGDEPEPPEVEVVTKDTIEPDQPETRLALNIHPGDRFPLVKTVRQKLEQATADGPVISESLLKLQMVITVESVQPDGTKRLGVKYHRVGYSRDVAGERLEYDSASPPRQLPLSVLPYHGLVGHGFSFDVGPDNRIKDVIGFQGFLEQCLRDVPASRRNAVLVELEKSQGEEGIANFVDDSIGLLPYDEDRTGRETVVKAGLQWKRKRQMARPVPLVEENTYTLKAIGSEVAEIDLTGAITPSASFGPSGQPTDGVIVAVRDGHVFGTCTIRRDSGLPIRSHVERFFNMIVVTGKDSAFQQRKHVVTTIETYEEQRSTESTPVIVPAAASAERESGPERPVIPADFSAAQP